MANKNVPQGGDANFQTLWIDQGSGVYALAVSQVSGGTASGISTTSGALLATGSVTLTSTGSASVVGVGITGTAATVTYNFEGTVDSGVTWVAINAYPLAGGTTVTTATANGNWIIPCAPFSSIRVRVSAIGSGTATIALRGGEGAWVPPLDSLGSLRVALMSLLAGEDQVNNRLKVEAQPADTDSVQETLQNAVTSTGTGTAVNLKGFKSVIFRVTATSGTWNGGVQLTMDDSNWYYAQIVRLSDGVSLNGLATQFNPVAAVTDDLYTLPNLPPAVSQARFNFAVRTSGTLTVTSRKAPR